MIKTFFKSFAVVALSAVLFVGCSSDDKKKVDKAPKLSPIDLSSLEMKFEASDLSVSEAQFAGEVEKGSLGELSLLDAFINRHAEDYMSASFKSEAAPVDPSQTAFRIEAMVSEIDKSNLNPNDLKVSFEKILETEVGELSYNKAHTSFFSAIYNQKSQCYSGTSLFEVVRRQYKTKDLKENRSVVIYESGHVLPGYMVWKNKSWNLVGVETTVSGKGKKNYGPVAGLFGARVIDADIFIATEVLGPKLTNHAEVMRNGLRLTAEKYGINLQESEKTVSEALIPYTETEGFSLSSVEINESLKDVINTSIFSFGSSKNVPEGDIERKQVDELKPTVSTGQYIVNGEMAFEDIIVPAVEVKKKKTKKSKNVIEISEVAYSGRKPLKYDNLKLKDIKSTITLKIKKSLDNRFLDSNYSANVSCALSPSGRSMPVDISYVALSEGYGRGYNPYNSYNEEYSAYGAEYFGLEQVRQFWGEREKIKFTIDVSSLSGKGNYYWAGLTLDAVFTNKNRYGSSVQDIRCNSNFELSSDITLGQLRDMLGHLFDIYLNK